MTASAFRKKERPDGMGLRIMSYRARLIHGKLEVRRGEDGGTLVSCLVMTGTEHGTNTPEGSRRGHQCTRQGPDRRRPSGRA